MPVALISTRTSPAFGPSRSTSTISNGFLASKATAARVFIVGSLRFVGRTCRPIGEMHQATRGARVSEVTELNWPSEDSSGSGVGQWLWRFAHAGTFRLGIGIGFVLALAGANAADSVVGAGTQIDVEVVHVAGDVAVIAERRHHIFLR